MPTLRPFQSPVQAGFHEGDVDAFSRFSVLSRGENPSVHADVIQQRALATQPLFHSEIRETPCGIFSYVD